MFLRTGGVALNAHRNWTLHNNNIAKAMQRLSTGKRINSAADDPAGLAVSEKLKLQLTLIDRDKTNALDYQSMLGVADGGLGEVQSMLQRMNELSKLAMNGTLGDTDRKNLDKEYQQLISEIDRIGKGTSYNGTSLFGKTNTMGGTAPSESNGSAQNQTQIIVGGNLNAYLDEIDKLTIDISNAAKANDNETLLSLGIDRSNGKSDSENLKNAIIEFTKANGEKLLNVSENSGSSGGQYTLVITDGDIKVEMPSVSGDKLGLGGTSLSTTEGAKEAADKVKDAISKVSSQRGDIGATHNRLNHTINNLSNMQGNLTEALSRITDADMAKEMMNLVKSQTLAQASMFVMAQANQESQQVLNLISSL